MHFLVKNLNQDIFDHTSQVRLSRGSQNHPLGGGKLFIPLRQRIFENSVPQEKKGVLCNYYLTED